MKKKITLDAFSSSILKADVSKNILGGYGNEGTSTTYCSGTTTNTYLIYPDADSNSHGDFYSSC